MAVERRTYPQVDPGAGGLMDMAVGACPAGASVKAALALLRRRRLRLLVTRQGTRWGVLLPRDLARARALGLAGRPAGEVARWEVPAVTRNAAEVVVRRRLLEGAPAVLVRDGRRIVGAVAPAAGRLRPGPSLLPRLERGAPDDVRTLLARIGRAAGEVGAQAFAVGGFVRDLLQGRPAGELDVAVEGDALAVARRLATELGGTLVVHRQFGTASLEGGGRRVDFATARRERYPARGALPLVAPASILRDLERRDFSVNAMAMRLGPGAAFGELLDPQGGRADLRRRRLRVLHPLSFVEDPTRIFRAARYEARLGLSLERWSRRGLRLALALVPYPALSGQRLLAELERLLAEPEGTAALLRLGGWGAFRLLDPSYRFGPATRRRLDDLARLRRWLRERAIGTDPVPLALVALLADSPRAMSERALARLALAGEPLQRILGALEDGPALAERLGAAAGGAPSRRAAQMRGRPLESLAAAWLWGAAPAREAVEWFLAEGRAVRPRLTGEDLVALGVPRGPAVRDWLDRLRDARLDGRLGSREAEEALARRWLAGAGAPAERP
jgi:tRNA nucleotidyltransferase (CCA-adding enzyme)